MAMPGTSNKNTHKGQTLAEYSLIFVGIVVVLIVSLQVLGVSVFNLFNQQISPALAMALGEGSNGNASQQEAPPVPMPSSPTSEILLTAEDVIETPKSPPAPTRITINPITGEIMADTSGNASNTNATSSQGKNLQTTLGTLRVGNTLEQMAESDRFDDSTSQMLRNLANSLYKAGGAEGFLDGNKAFIPPKKQSFIFKEKTYKKGDAIADLKTAQTATKTLMSSLSKKLSSTDYQVVSSLVSTSQGVITTYLKKNPKDIFTGTKGNTIDSALGGIDTLKTTAKSVLQKKKATEPVLVTIDAAETTDRKADEFAHKVKQLNKIAENL